jgi:hypothetical protein
MKYRRSSSLSRPLRAAERPVQLTVRNVPPKVASALRRKAEGSDQSLNRVLVDALTKAVGGDAPVVHHDLDALIGSWEEDPAFDEALRAQHVVDKKLWK